MAVCGLALEKMDHSGIWTVTATGRHYPDRLRTRLRDSAPVVLHGVGDTCLLDTDGVGVVSSWDTSAEGSRVAGEVAEVAVKVGLAVVSGAARGVDSDAMNAAVKVGGQVVGVLADSLERAVARRNTRQRVVSGQICLITPYVPAAPFSVGNAMGSNKIIYGLSRCTVVIACDREAGGTWAGATEGVKNGYGRVASWTSAGSGPGNSALVGLGADELTDIAQLHATFTDTPNPARRIEDPLGQQLSLGF